jgi:hypothetical protein
LPGVCLRGHPHLTAVVMEKLENSKAYRCGWNDGCYGELECFSENRRLAEWKTSSDRLDYYKGHRAGREARRRTDCRLEAS